MAVATRDREDASRLWLGLALVGVAAVLLLNIASFGIWDPWELEAADTARRIAEATSASAPHARGAERAPHAGVWASSIGFMLFGVDEASGRIPVALGGLLAALLAYALVARFASRRAGVYALLVAGTSPLFVFNARAMLGEAPSFAVQAAIALAACIACFGDRRHTMRRHAALGATLVLVVLGVEARGALLCALPPVLAVAVVAAYDGRLRAKDDPAGTLAAFTLWGLSILFAGAIAHGVVLDAGSYSPWLGGSPRGGQPPRFDFTIERVFHAFAPWSALLPLAMARMPLGVPESDVQQDSRDDEQRLRMVLLLWAGLGYAAHTLFLSRYGDAAAYLPVVALAGMVALFLRDVERSGGAQWPAAIVTCMLAGLLIRDYSLYPAAPIHGMAIDDFEIPKVFNPKQTWGALIGAFAALCALCLGAADQPQLRDSSLLSPFRFLRELWRRGLGHRMWLIGAALLLLLLEVLGILTMRGDLGVTTSTAKWMKRLMLLPPALPLGLVALHLVLKLFARLRARSLPILLAGVLTGAYAGQGFMPALSAHFSPREVYETYNALARDDEPLGEYKVGGRAAAYYAKGPIEELDTTTALVKFLGGDGRRWAVFPESDLPAVDRMFRRREQRHLFVADARSARVLLATNQPVKGRDNGNFLVEHVLEKEPEIQHRVEANLEDKLLFLGYDLELPHGDHVSPGEKFSVTWYYRALKHVPGNWRVFVHIDGEGKRIHGDHYPIDGRYPVSMWEPGDVIVDPQTLEVPTAYPATDFTIYLGLYSGEKRLEVKSGPSDGENRIRAGVLRIR